VREKRKAHTIVERASRASEEEKIGKRDGDGQAAREAQFIQIL
jgi:hypothetical protein